MLVQQQIEGQLFIAVITQQGQDMLRRKESGLHSVLFQPLHQLGIHLIPQFPLRDDHLQGHNVSTLIVILHGTVFFDKCFEIGISGLFQLRFIPLGIFLLAKQVCCPDHDPKVIDNKCVGYRAIVHSHEFHVPACCQPVTQTRLNPQILLSEESAHFPDLTFYEGLHAVVVFPDIAVSTVVMIQHLRHDTDTVAPTQHTHEADSGLALGRDRGTNVALGVIHLGITDIFQEFIPEYLRIEVVGTGMSEDLPVAGVAHPLIPLRAVGGNFHIVGFLSPDLIAVELVCQRVFAGKVSCPLHVGIDGISGQQAVLIGNTGKLNIPEAHIGKPRTVDTSALVIYDLRFCFPKIRSIEASVCFQNLAMAKFQAVPFHLCRIDTDNTCKVLPKVEDSNIAPNRHGLHGHFLPDADSAGSLAQMLRKGCGGTDRLAYGRESASLIHFTVVEPSILPGAFQFRHGFIGRSVNVVRFKNPGDGGLFAVDLHLIVEGEPAAVPALRQINAKGVFSRCKVA